MIGSLRGTIIHKSRDNIEIDINGVGYEVHLGTRDLNKVKNGEDVEVFTYHHLSEDKNELFGFINRSDKKVFEMLISVSGIGPKSAIGITSMATSEKIIKAISEADVEFFKEVKGIGKKSAQRIIVDLKSEVGGVKDLDLEEEAKHEVVYEALQNLGFHRTEVRKALADLPDQIQSDDEKIKFALRELSE
jgi:Holliday junction DNA helicase RuvA